MLVSVTLETKGYDKEKKATLCQNCNTEKEVKIIKKHKDNTKKKVVQHSIFSALKVQSTSTQNPKQHKATSQQTRIVTPATVEKCKSEMAVHSLSDWLTYSIDKNGKVQDMKRTVCAKYEEQIKDMPNFSNVLIKGSKNYRKSVTEEHGTKSGPHLKAMSPHLKYKDVLLNERANLLSSVHFANIHIALGRSTMDKNNLARTKRKFEVVYFFAKQQLSMTKYELLLRFGQMHGIDIDPTYLTDQYCGTFIYFCGNKLKKSIDF